MAPLVVWTSVHGLAEVVAHRLLPADVPVEEAPDAVLDGVRRALTLHAEGPGQESSS